jgi:hypothetical protein
LKSIWYSTESESALAGESMAQIWTDILPIAREEGHEELLPL